MSKKPSPPTNKDRKPRFDSQQAQAIAKYSGIAIQMGIIIVLGVLLGQKLDSWLQTSKPIFAMVCSLLAVFLAMYYSLKDFITPTKDKDKDKDKDKET